MSSEKISLQYNTFFPAAQAKPKNSSGIPHTMPGLFLCIFPGAGAVRQA